MDELSLAVVGITHPNADKAKSNRLFELLQCVRGEAVDLIPEPKNKFDEHAIAVFSARGIQIGYITAERAPFIGSKIRAGLEVVAVFQQLNQYEAVIRVRFGGGEPTLPPPQPAPARDAPRRRSPPPLDPDGFYPDPDGPEFGA